MIYKISPNPSFPKRGIEKSKKLPTRLREGPFFKERIYKTIEPLAKLFVIPECFYRGYGFSSS
jgi:hypothetical protein